MPPNSPGDGGIDLPELGEDVLQLVLGNPDARVADAVDQLVAPQLDADARPAPLS